MLATEMMKPAIDFTANAAYRVWQLIQEEENPQLNLRLYISGGGCSGFQYNFKFDETINEGDDGDFVFARDAAEALPADTKRPTSNDMTVRLLVDPMSYSLLVGAAIDFAEEQFIIRNPNAKTTCGCGSSFDAAEPANDA
jgi:iron-sulfur cluster insertion protein